MAEAGAVAEFRGVTAASAADAEAFLVAAGGDVEAAVEAYFEARARQGARGAGGRGSAPRWAAHPSRPRRAPPTCPPPSSRSPDDDDEPELAPAPAAAPRARRAGGGAAGNVRSLADLAGSSSGDDDHNELYTGGAKSGQVVRGPPSGPPGDADALFDAARAAGARSGRAEDLDPGAGGSGGGGGVFTGAARTLAGPDPPPPGPAAPPPPPPPAPIIITFYDDGIFTVNGGPPRRVDDPGEAAFVGAVARGELPAELSDAVAAAGTPGAPVPVNLVRAHGDYVAPAAPAHVPFSGAGQKLGDAAGASGSGAAAPPPAPVPPLTAGAWDGPDESLPMTSLQLRLADGSRLVARFNAAHTLAHVRAFLAAARPAGPTSYAFLAGVPPAVVAEDGASLEAAGLLNAVLTQRPA
jgi:UBX domain-containing protein 1